MSNKAFDPMNRKNHGCLFDRGAADSWYRRGNSKPHYGGVGGEAGPRVEVSDPAQIAEYQAGYAENEADAEARKDWG